MNIDITFCELNPEPLELCKKCRRNDINRIKAVTISTRNSVSMSLPEVNKEKNTCSLFYKTGEIK